MVGEIVKYFDDSASIAVNTFIIFSASGCILAKATGRTLTNNSKLFSIIYIEIKIIDW